MVLSKRGGGAAMGSKPLPVPAPVLPSPYRPVDASWDSEEDAPGPRCGHTLTAVAGTGNPDSPDYVGPRLILFGGATAIEDGSSAFGGGIMHVYDVLSRKWKRYLPVGEPPSPRAAHTATAVGTMVVIQGGIGPAGHSTDDLYVLDLNHSKFKWHRVVVQGPGPGPRYGHVMDLIAQRYLVTVSGNDGKRTLSDAWALDTSQKPYRWQRLEPEGDMPSARMYATASARADGMLLPCGGRDSSGLPQSDAYGLLKHRDGRWEWTLAPGVSPSPRYQHAAVGLLFLYWASTGLFGGVFVFPTERELLAKGRSSNMYRLSAYYMSSTLCDTVAQIFYATIFYCIVYFMANFQRTASAFLLTLLGLYLVIFTAHGTGELIGAAVPDIRRTGLVASIVLLVFMITGGFYIQHMPVFIRWLKYVSFVFYGFRFVVKMQYSPHQIYDCTGPGGCKSIQSSPSFETMGLDGGMQEVWILILTALAYRIVAYFYLNKIKLL